MCDNKDIWTGHSASTTTTTTTIGRAAHHRVELPDDSLCRRIAETIRLHASIAACTQYEYRLAVVSSSSSSSYGRVRRTTIAHGKFYLPMTSRKFELCTKKKRQRPARRDSIKAERHDDAMEHRRCRQRRSGGGGGRIVIIRRRRRRRRRDVERNQQQCNAGRGDHQLRSTESVDVEHRWSVRRHHLFRSVQPGTAVVVAILLQADDTREDLSDRERSS